MAGDPAASVNATTLRDVIRRTGFGAAILVRTSGAFVALGRLALPAERRV